MKSNGAMRTWLESVPIERDGVSWAVSLGVHLALLVLLAVHLADLPDRPSGAMLSSWNADDASANLQEVQYSEATGETDEVGGNGLQGTGMALATAPSLGEISRIDTGQMEASDVGAGELPVMVELSAAPNLSDRWPCGRCRRRGQGGEGAVDRITQEIMDSLDKRPNVGRLADGPIGKPASAAGGDRAESSSTSITSWESSSPAAVTLSPSMAVNRC